MTHLVKRALIAAGLTLTPVLPAMLGQPAEAHESVGVSVNVSVPTRTGVFGFSYGNPTFAGHVHYSPVHCAAGPLYYYPNHRVYGHYHQGLRYHYYEKPVYYYAPPPIHRHGHYAPVHWKKHHKHYDRHGHHDRCHHDDDDDDD